MRLFVLTHNMQKTRNGSIVFEVSPFTSGVDKVEITVQTFEEGQVGDRWLVNKNEMKQLIRALEGLLQ